jgi:acetyl esterase/lipase
MNAARHFWIVLAAAMLCGCQSIYFGTVNALSADNDVYMTTQIFDPANELALDVYRSAGAGARAPVLVFFYGGTWRSGQKSWYRFVGESLAAQGVIVVIPDYRHYPEGRFPDFMQDAAAAIRFSRQHARAWGGDPERLFVSGHSAGAHIAVLIATDARHLEAQHMHPRELRGVIGIAGPYDFAPFDSRKLLQAFPDRAGQAQTQPINFVDGDEPPMLLLHGTGDNTVWPRNSERLAEKLRAQDIEVELRLYPGISHSRIMKALGQRYVHRAPTRGDMLRFIEQH